MTRTRAARLMGLIASLLVVLPLASGGVAAAQSQAQEMLICHRTGSPTNPWVFMSIDASTWPEHEAQGDVRASSLADCTALAAAPATGAQQVAPVAPPAPPAPPAQASISAPPASPAQGSSLQAPSSSQAASPSQPSSQAASPAQASSAAQASSPAQASSVAQAASPAQASSQVASPAESPPQVANVQVASPEQSRSQVADVQGETAPPVSSLPASGEPNRPALVAGLLTLLAVGLGLRRLGQRRA